MNVHRNTSLTPIQRRKLVEDYFKHHTRACDLKRKYHISAPTVYKIIHRSRDNDYSIHRSENKRFRCVKYGLKRLAKVETRLEKKLKKQAKRYNKEYPGEMLHLDTKRLPLLAGESPKHTHEYLFVAVDDFSRELYAAIILDKTQHSAEKFLKQILDEYPYTIEQIYTDNGLEYKGHPDRHAFANLCRENSIEQRFTQVKRPRTNGKAERMIRTIMDMWHKQTRFNSRKHRKTELIRFINYYNIVKPHKGINGQTPMEKLIDYFYPTEL
jgi:transposase InsO family protein